MGKLISWVVMGAVGYLAFRLLQVVQRKSLAARGVPGAPGHVARTSGAGPARELMLRCDVCGTHVPGSEALTVNGRHYCSAAHRDQAD